jgi:cytochrome c oxidase subunit 2
MRRVAPLALLASLAACSVAPPDTVQGMEMFDVWKVFVVAGIAVYAIVSALIVWPAIAHRRRDPTIRQARSTVHKNDKLEITWTVIPVLIVIGLFIKTYLVEAKVEAVQKNPAQVVNVVGYRWSWRFTYPRNGVVVNGSTQAAPTLVLPVNETTQINLTSSDVIHSLWVPAFIFKRDANPGSINVFDFKPTRIGTYPGSCAEFCGTLHALMDFKVRIVSQAEFARWVRQQGGKI